MDRLLEYGGDTTTESEGDEIFHDMPTAPIPPLPPSTFTPGVLISAQETQGALEMTIRPAYVYMNSAPPTETTPEIIHISSSSDEEEEFLTLNLSSSDVVEENVVNAALSTRTKTRTKNDKKQYCILCKKMVSSSNFLRHLKTHHANSTEVKKITSTLNQEERSKLLHSLRKKGNFIYNENVLKTGKGTIILKRRIPLKDKGNYKNIPEDFKPCKHCLGYYSSKQLSAHERTCKEKRQEEKVGEKGKEHDKPAASGILKYFAKMNGAKEKNTPTPQQNTSKGDPKTSGFIGLKSRPLASNSTPKQLDQIACFTEPEFQVNKDTDDPTKFTISSNTFYGKKDFIQSDQENDEDSANDSDEDWSNDDTSDSSEEDNTFETRPSNMQYSSDSSSESVSDYYIGSDSSDGELPAAKYRKVANTIEDAEHDTEHPPRKWKKWEEMEAETAKHALGDFIIREKQPTKAACERAFAEYPILASHCENNWIMLKSWIHSVIIKNRKQQQ